jgi:hypothetical protein
MLLMALADRPPQTDDDSPPTLWLQLTGDHGPTTESVSPTFIETVTQFLSPRLLSLVFGLSCRRPSPGLLSSVFGRSYPFLFSVGPILSYTTSANVRSVYLKYTIPGTNRARTMMELITIILKSRLSVPRRAHRKPTMTPAMGLSM